MFLGYTFKILTVLFCGLTYRQVDCILNNHNRNNNQISLLSDSILYGIASLNKLTDVNETDCDEDLRILYESVNDNHDWALKVLDASGQPESSFLYGNNIWIGSQTFCNDMQNRSPLKLNYAKLSYKPINNNTYPPYSLKFMIAYIKHNNTLQQHTRITIEDTIYLGLCIPQTCNTYEIKLKLNDYLKRNYLNVQRLYNLRLDVKSTKLLREDYIWFFKLPKVYCGIIFFTSYLVIIICGTCYGVRNPLEKKENKMIDVDQETNNHCYNNRNDSSTRYNNLLRCFDLSSNIKSILTTKKKSGNNSNDLVKCIDGLRFFFMYLAILGHSIYYGKDFVRNPAAAIRLSETFLSQITTNIVYVVDGFFFIGGFLLGYTFFKKYKNEINAKSNDGKKGFKRKALEFVTVLIMRIVRIIPAYLVIIYTTDVLFTYLYEVYPIHFQERPEINCDRYWWRNLLFINNLYPRSEMCLSWSYYLSNDMQFFIVSLLILMLSTAYFKLAAFAIFGLLLSSIGINGYIFYKINYMPTLDEFLERLDVIYDLPWLRINPYLIGIITSYVLVIKLENRLNLSKSVTVSCWIFFPLLNIWILFGLYGKTINFVYTIFYMTVSKTVWAIGLVWTVIACHTRHGGALNRFLTFRIWTPFNRMSLCVYLLNPLLNVAFAETSDTYSNFSIGFCIKETIALFAASYVIAIFATAIFEYPFINLIKMYIKYADERSSIKNDDNTNNVYDLNGTKKLYFIDRYTNGTTITTTTGTTPGTIAQ